MARKEVAKVTLKNGEEIITSLDRGEAARRAMAAGSGIWTVPDQGNKTVDAKLIGGVQDVFIEDVQVQLGEQLHEAKRILPESERIKPTATSPGYIKFLLAQRKFARNKGGRFRPLTDEQRIIIEEIEIREGILDENGNEIKKE